MQKEVKVILKTEIFKIDPDNIDQHIIDYCGKKIREGKLVCFPTETVYGLGANALDEKAVQNIFIAKGRPQDNPLIVHISDIEMVESIASGNERELFILKQLSDKFWPGPLTQITTKNENISDSVTCGLNTVGIRFPSNMIAISLIKSAGVPVAAPSANVSGRPSPTRASHVIEDLDGRVDIIIDGGSCLVGVESTVLDISVWPPCILRPGAVTLEDLQEIIQEASEFIWQKEVEKPRSPGMKYKHYAPNATVTLFSGDEKLVAERINEEMLKAKKAGIEAWVLASDETLCYYIHDKVLSLGSKNNLPEQASRLYDCLRRFDELNVDVVFAEVVPSTGFGDAIMNRLYRAAGGRIVYVE